MNRTLRLGACALAAWACASLAHAQNSDGKPPNGGPPDWSAFKAHVDKAKAAAGTLWGSEQRYFCLPGQRADRDDDPAAEPVKLFDNVYALGQTYTVAYAVVTPDGVVLLDSGRLDRTEDIILPSLRKVGIDPAKVNYVLVSQPGADHWGGAKWFQDHGAHVALSDAGWNALANFTRLKPKEPTRDLVLEDGKPLVVDGLTVTPVDIPGPPPAMQGLIFPVVDHGRTRMAAIFSSIMRADRLSPGTVRTHADALRRFGAITAKAKVEVELENHPLYDDMWERVERLKAGRPGDPNPFLVGQGGYQRFVTVMDECLRATIARKGG